MNFSFRDEFGMRGVRGKRKFQGKGLNLKEKKNVGDLERLAVRV
jgi:hypothetical protein